MIETFRGSERESVHRVLAAHCDTDGRLIHESEPGAGSWRFFLRSAAKPFQAAPAVAQGVIDTLGLTSQHLAVACSSHDGSERYTRLVREILESAGLDEAALQTGSDGQGTPIQHQCSGNHALGLAWAAVRGWPTASYCVAENPVQQGMNAAVAQAVGAEVMIAPDNCGMSTHQMTLSNAATAFARLASPEADTFLEGLGTVAAAMRRHPELVRPRGQIDAELMATDPQLVAKVGAEAALGIGHSDLGGIALRVLDGGTRAWGPAGSAVAAEWFSTDGTGLEQPALLDAHGRPIGHTAARWE